MKAKSGVMKLGVIQLFLGFLGYVKVPKEAIFLSTRQEVLFEKLIEKLESLGVEDEIVSVYTHCLEGQRVLTKFLRSGRLLNS